MRRRSSGSAAEEDGADSDSTADVITSSNEAGGSSNSDESTSNTESRNLQTIARPSTTQPTSHELDRRKSTDKKASTDRIRRPSNTNWKLTESRNGHLENNRPADLDIISVPRKRPLPPIKCLIPAPMLVDRDCGVRGPVPPSRSLLPCWACSLWHLYYTRLLLDSWIQRDVACHI